MGTNPRHRWVCSRCGRPFSVASPGLGCLVCLLADGLDGSGAGEVPAPDPVAGERFGDFEVARAADGSPHELGRGAMGTTYLARDTVLDRPVALKIIGARVAARPGARARFLREARGAAALRHPNVASIFQYGVREADGQPFYAMEFIEGETLEERVRRDGPLPMSFALEAAAQIARALGAAEARGLVHRDLKPSNVMLTGGQTNDPVGERHVKVIDFGLARTVLAATGSTNPAASQTAGGFAGTPAFASPEQFAGIAAGVGTLDVRADIFSLGVTLWYLLTSRVPFVGRTLAEIHERQTRHPLPVEQLARVAAPAPVVALLRSLLAPDPAARPQNARELATALRDCQQKLASPHARRAWVYGVMAAAIIIFAVIAAFLLGGRTGLPVAPGPVPVAAPEKSVAVLPFTNLGGDPANAFLADGMQDEILTDLARVTDLKVISRTSVMAHRDAPRENVRDIGRDLGVAYVLEGSVAREGSRVRVTAQLIDARTDAHVWAERYDRPADSLFALQDEVAAQIAARLPIRLTDTEREAMRARPTADLTAYELYLHASDLAVNFASTRDARGALDQAVRLLGDATARDPAFHRAWCLLSNVHAILYHAGLDATPACLDRARDALDTARRLQPDSGETHYAAALLAVWGVPDYPQARAELALALCALPNDARVLRLAGGIALMDAHWDECIRLYQQSVAVDPRDETSLNDLASVLSAMRRYDDERRVIDQGIANHETPVFWQLRRGMNAMYGYADPAPLRAHFAPLPPGTEPDVDAAVERLELSFWTRDFATAAQVLAKYPPTDTLPAANFLGTPLPRAWFDGLLAHYRGDETAARRAFAAARDAAQAQTADRPDDVLLLGFLGQLDALLGRKEDALREARLACERKPVTKSAGYGGELLVGLAQVEAWTGEKDLALGHLADTVHRPYGPSYGDLRMNPDWDALRGDPRFEALCKELAPAAK